MKERPILFSAPMVRAILEGRKSQTRRAIKPQPFIDACGNVCVMRRGSVDCYGQHTTGEPHWEAFAALRCRYGRAGDRLWVRETWAQPNDQATIYRANWREDAKARGFDNIPADDSTITWRPSIHMPRWASRITLKVTDVRVERLQEISNDDCEAEGIKQRWTCINPGTGSYAHDNDVQDDYRKLWIDINGPDSWAANPWVWVVSFERVTP